MFIEESSNIWNWKPSDPPRMQQAVADVVMRLTDMCHEKDPYQMFDGSFSKPSKQQGSRRHASFRGQKGSDWMEGNNSNNVSRDLIGRETSQGNEWANEGGEL